MNMVEKILARASGRKEVVPGDVVVSNVDRMVMHDLSSNFVTRVFEGDMENAKIADPDRIAIVFDHHFSPSTEAAAHDLAAVREWVKRHGIRHFYDCGSGSIHHVIIERKLWSPGQVIVGCDSHTPIYGALGTFATGIGNNSMAALAFPYSLGWFRVPETINVVFEGELQPGVTPRDISQYLVGRIGEDGAIYRALEFSGPFIENLSVADRLLFPLMTIDMGGKTGYVNPDEKTLAFAASNGGPQQYEIPTNDTNVAYVETVEIDVGAIGPQIACPPTVGNVQSIDAVAGTPIQLAEVGGSTGGRLEDLRMLAQVLDGRQVHPDVRLQVVPATRGILLEALHEGLVDTLVRAGGTLYPPSCGSNQAANMGAMDETEAMISTQARNFPGRNGSPKARHYLGSPLTVGASALAGVITPFKERA